MNCQYCNKECKNKNSLTQHEIRCNKNPNKIVCNGNKGNVPIHYKSYYTDFIKVKGTTLDITKQELDNYRHDHNRCEICGRTIEESVKWNSKFAPKNFCIDHDHSTNKFRGLLCSVCNRQLGWYEKYKDKVDKYLNK